MLQIDRTLSLTVTSQKAAERLLAALSLAVGLKLTDAAALELEAAQKELRRRTATRESGRFTFGTEAAEALARAFEERAEVVASIPGCKLDPDEELQAADYIRRAVRP